jgi:hypothetical protein
MPRDDAQHLTKVAHTGAATAKFPRHTCGNQSGAFQIRVVFLHKFISLVVLDSACRKHLCQFFGRLFDVNDGHFGISYLIHVITSLFQKYGLRVAEWFEL